MAKPTKKTAAPVEARRLYPTPTVLRAAASPRWFLQRLENAGALTPVEKPEVIGRGNTSSWTASDALALAAAKAFHDAGFTGPYVTDVAEFVAGEDPEGLEELIEEGYTLVALAGPQTRLVRPLF